ncbi:hypothetical protein [Nocardioides sp. PD653]|uniref:hypothetical protein n=1 Tax=Nocardioides sp. PD653 TaxID=393303 RepID=UPI0009F15F1A|nr:hypothetical protein [Nocardioides sp. PD653]GAW54798.1 uncharacterized protein PD653_2212 [Nocardioides sp. PD653]
MADENDITLARLDGTARRHLDEHTPRDQAITALQAITSDPTLLGFAAGRALGAHRHNPVSSWQGAAVAELLIDAGADPDVTETRAAETAARLTYALPS